MTAGRFAPSPTGPLHLGNLRTALLAWLFARSTDREFLLRVEDLDRVRSGFEQQQLAELQAFGITWEYTPVRQSERTEIYDAALELLQKHGLIYECFCSRKDIADAASAPNAPLHVPGAYPGTCRHLSLAQRRERAQHRPAALRINAALASGLSKGSAQAEGSVVEHTITDVLHGNYTGVVDDFVVRRNDGAYAYNLAVVVDDAIQGIDQVVRGDDLLSSTPRQHWLAGILADLSDTTPVQTEYVHVPLVLNAQGKRLAKRDGAVTLEDLGALNSAQRLHEVRSWILDSLGLPTHSLEEALEAFTPESLPNQPWYFNQPGQ